MIDTYCPEVPALAHGIRTFRLLVDHSCCRELALREIAQLRAELEAP